MIILDLQASRGRAIPIILDEMIKGDEDNGHKVIKYYLYGFNIKLASEV